MNNSPSLGKGLFLQKMQTGEIEIVLRPGAMTLAAAPPRSRPMVEFDLCPNLASRLMMLRRWVTFISMMSLISSNCSGCKKGASKNHFTSRPLAIDGASYRHGLFENERFLTCGHPLRIEILLFQPFRRMNPPLNQQHDTSPLKIYK